MFFFFTVLQVVEKLHNNQTHFLITRQKTSDSDTTCFFEHFLASIKSSNICGRSETRDEGTSAMLTFSHILAGKAALSITFM